ncbi:MAG: phosphonate C-P lyase system protein PhnH [Rhodobacteraceae bacterium]|nr:phosphonate C-P lyase system protein PhnH [Paracoccaceae bacterium]
MDAISLQGGFAEAAPEAARAFRAVLNAMARPGTVEPVAGARPPAPLSMAAGVVLLTLADTTTPMHLAPSHDLPVVRDWITFHTGAPFVAAGRAVFALGDWAGLAPLDRFPIGTSEYPDRAATLIVEVAALAPATHRLTGPGILDAAQLRLPGGEAARLNAGRFPLGLDLILCCGDRLAGVPRTTKLEAL